MTDLDRMNATFYHNLKKIINPRTNLPFSEWKNDNCVQDNDDDKTFLVVDYELKKIFYFEFKHVNWLRKHDLYNIPYSKQLQLWTMGHREGFEEYYIIATFDKNWEDYWCFFNGKWWLDVEGAELFAETFNPQFVFYKGQWCPVLNNNTVQDLINFIYNNNKEGQ